MQLFLQGGLTEEVCKNLIRSLFRQMCKMQVGFKNLGFKVLGRGVWALGLRAWGLGVKASEG